MSNKLFYYNISTFQNHTFFIADIYTLLHGTPVIQCRVPPPDKANHIEFSQHIVNGTYCFFLKDSTVFIMSVEVKYSEWYE